MLKYVLNNYYKDTNLDHVNNEYKYHHFKFISNYHGCIINKMCDKGNLEIAKILFKFFFREVEKNINNFDVHPREIYHDINCYLYNICKGACKYGNYDIMAWLLDDFLFKNNNYKPNISQNREYIFRTACVNGHFEIVRLLKKYFPNIDHHVFNNHCHRNATNNKILCWLENDCQFSSHTKSARKN